MTPEFRLSIAIPLHNEESILAELVTRCIAVLDGISGGPHELLFVDDGSTDRTLSILEEFAHHDARIIVLSLSRNFGHQAALTAALDHVTGDATVLMDGDLQDPPEAISRLLEKFFEGYDVVYAQRTRRKEAWLLRVCYYVFYRLIALWTLGISPCCTGPSLSICNACLNITDTSVVCGVGSASPRSGYQWSDRNGIQVAANIVFYVF